MSNRVFRPRLLLLLLPPLLLVLGYLAVTSLRTQESAALFAASLHDQDNQSIALAGLRGQPLIVNFWSQWCVSCRAKIPDLSAIAQAYGAQGLQVVGIGLEGHSPDLQHFIQTNRMDYHLLFAPVEGNSLMRALGNGRAVIPFTIAIDRHGRVVMHKIGRASRAELEQAAVAALGRS